LATRRASSAALSGWSLQVGKGTVQRGEPTARETARRRPGRGGYAERPCQGDDRSGARGYPGRLARVGRPAPIVRAPLQEKTTGHAGVRRAIPLPERWYGRRPCYGRLRRTSLQSAPIVRVPRYPRPSPVGGKTPVDGGFLGPQPGPGRRGSCGGMPAIMALRCPAGT
jgi:hypothetical protein